MVQVVNGFVVCSKCGSEMTHDNTPGYWLCTNGDCGYRFYGDPGRVLEPNHCLKCETDYPAGMRSCPNCGMAKEDN